MLYENRTMKHSFATHIYIHFVLCLGLPQLMQSCAGINANFIFILCLLPHICFMFLHNSSLHTLMFIYINIYIYLFMPTYVDVCCAFCWMISQFMQSIDLFFLCVRSSSGLSTCLCFEFGFGCFFFKALTDIKRSSNCLLEWR